MSVVEGRTNLWEVLAGRAPDKPLGPADPGLWRAVVDRLNPAKAKPTLRGGIEEATLRSVRGQRYVMLRAPDRDAPRYLRLTPEEVELAHRMDGTRTVAALVGEFTRISGRLAPDHVVRLVADLAGNRMLDELPLDAFRPLEHARARRRPLPVRIGRGLLATARGRRMVLADIDAATAALYRTGARWLFTRTAAVLMGVVALAGMATFVWTWAGGAERVVFVGGSYATGALVLLGLNVVALASHELGHALAAMHAGRRVPAMGLLLYFGLPSVFVDTTDVWMTGRRARLVTSAAGPVAAVTLAGAVQLVSLLVPALGPVAFKLAFVWYLNSLFNLNPLMALDGYYLFMDWLEIPNLRPRATAMLMGWVRRRRPRWTELDREGRLIAVYAVLAALWLVVMTNLAVRMYRDRVSGLVVGLWHLGPAARLLVVAIVAALGSPVLYALGTLAGRRWRMLRTRWLERRRTADLPRRAAALRRGVLGGLPEAPLTAIAEGARWLHPRGGDQVLDVGTPPREVLVVVDGMLEGRRPGDPPGSIRARAGPGDLVGAAAALGATTSALAWTAVGTRLLAMPAGVFVEIVGPFVTTPPQTDPAEAEALLDDTPVLAGMSEGDRLAILGHLRPVDLDPGRRVEVGAGQAAVVGSGVLQEGEGRTGAELRRGQLLGPPRGDEPLSAEARTRARVWPLPALASGLGALLAAGGGGVAPAVGVHPDGGYPPLTPRPGTAPTADEGPDRRLLRRLVFLLLLVLLLVVVTGRIAAVDSLAWAEMPGRRVLVTAAAGEVTVVISGDEAVLSRGARRYVADDGSIRVGPEARALLTFRGGAEVVLCPASALAVGSVAETGRRPVQPTARLTLERGALLADTDSRTGAFRPLELTVDVGPHQLTSREAAVFGAVASRANPVDAATGAVLLDGVAQPTSGVGVTCPGRQDGSAAAPDREARVPAAPTSGPPSVVTTAPDDDADVTTSTTPGSIVPSTTTAAATSPPTSPPSPSTDPTRPPPADRPPVIDRAIARPSRIEQEGSGCRGETKSHIIAEIRDDEDGPQDLTVQFHYELDTDRGVSGSGAMAHAGGNTFEGTLGPFAAEKMPSNGGTFTVTVTVVDSAGNTATSAPFRVELAGCREGEAR